MIQMTSVSKWYHDRTRVLDQIQLELKKGDFLYVVGGSGAGKSSFLRLLATEEAPSTGTVSLFGYPLHSVSPTTLRAIRQMIGYVPQGVRLISDFSVADNIALSLALGGRRAVSGEVHERIRDIMDRLGLLAKKDVPVSSLSGGEAQRVAFARALVRQPELIVADEPTGSQDKDYTWAMMDLLVKANRAGTTVVMATHDREIVRRVRKPCANLNQGRLMLEESLCFY